MRPPFPPAAPSRFPVTLRPFNLAPPPLYNHFQMDPKYLRNMRFAKKNNKKVEA